MTDKKKASWDDEPKKKSSWDDEPKKAEKKGASASTSEDPFNRGSKEQPDVVVKTGAPGDEGVTAVRYTVKENPETLKTEVLKVTDGEDNRAIATEVVATYDSSQEAVKHARSLIQEAAAPKLKSEGDETKKSAKK